MEKCPPLMKVFQVIEDDSHDCPIEGNDEEDKLVESGQKYIKRVSSFNKLLNFENFNDVFLDIF
jgi:hypothetical protein